MKRQNLRTVSLIVVTFTYLLIGAAIFGWLESEHEFKQREALEWIERIIRKKYNISEDDFTVLTTTVIKSVPHKAGIQWKFPGAFYFATTVVTTIGYGHSTPSTTWGRSFCMVYALIGIPLGLVMFQSIGERLNTFVGSALRYAKRCFKARNPDVTQTNLVMVVSVLSTILMTSMAAVFAKYERWDYFDALYYCFITLTTIGFGDFVALQKESALQSKPQYVVLSLIFILFGLSVVSSAVNLLVLKFLTLNTEDERRDEQLRYTAAMNPIQLEGDVITSSAGKLEYARQKRPALTMAQAMARSSMRRDQSRRLQSQKLAAASAASQRHHLMIGPAQPHDQAKVAPPHKSKSHSSPSSSSGGGLAALDCDEPNCDGQTSWSRSVRPRSAGHEHNKFVRRRRGRGPAHGDEQDDKPDEVEEREDQEEDEEEDSDRVHCCEHGLAFRRHVCPAESADEGEDYLPSGGTTTPGREHNQASTCPCLSHARALGDANWPAEHHTRRVVTRQTSARIDPNDEGERQQFHVPSSFSEANLCLRAAQQQQQQQFLPPHPARTDEVEANDSLAAEQDEHNCHLELGLNPSHSWHHWPPSPFQPCQAAIRYLTPESPSPNFTSARQTLIPAAAQIGTNNELATTSPRPDDQDRRGHEDENESEDEEEDRAPAELLMSARSLTKQQQGREAAAGQLFTYSDTMPHQPLARRGGAFSSSTTTTSTSHEQAHQQRAGHRAAPIRDQYRYELTSTSKGGPYHQRAGGSSRQAALTRCCNQANHFQQHHRPPLRSKIASSQAANQSSCSCSWISLTSPTATSPDAFASSNVVPMGPGGPTQAHVNHLLNSTQPTFAPTYPQALESTGNLYRRRPAAQAAAALPSGSRTQSRNLQACGHDGEPMARKRSYNCGPSCEDKKLMSADHVRQLAMSAGGAHKSKFFQSSPAVHEISHRQVGDEDEFLAGQSFTNCDNDYEHHRNQADSSLATPKHEPRDGRREMSPRSPTSTFDGRRPASRPGEQDEPGPACGCNLNNQDTPRRRRSATTANSNSIGSLGGGGALGTSTRRRSANESSGGQRQVVVPRLVCKCCCQHAECIQYALTSDERKHEETQNDQNERGENVISMQGNNDDKELDERCDGRDVGQVPPTGQTSRATTSTGQLAQRTQTSANSDRGTTVAAIGRVPSGEVSGERTSSKQTAGTPRGIVAPSEDQDKQQLGGTEEQQQGEEGPK